MSVQPLTCVPAAHSDVIIIVGALAGGVGGVPTASQSGEGGARTINIDHGHVATALRESTKKIKN